MPALLEKLKQWRVKHRVGHYFSGIYPSPDYLKLNVFGHDVFKDDIKKIMSIMPTDTDEDLLAKEYMQGILNEIVSSTSKQQQIKDLIVFLDEKDRRRKTNWRDIFPWIEQHVV